MGLLLFLAYLGYLDYTVRYQFQGQRWELPSYVYARPLELYAGAPVTPERLQATLDDLHYRLDTRLTTPASYVRRGDEFWLSSRPFRFWDKEEANRRVKVVLEGGRVAAMQDLANGKDAALVRLDPVQIGSFYPSRKEDRILVKLAEVPPLLIQGLLAMEDRDFYHHHGVSPRAIARAMWANTKAMGLVQGGSTITQQLVKNFYLTSKRSLGRKINEAFMALIMDARYPKDEILEAYLNEIYLGQDGARAIHGFGLASEFYFSRPLHDLKLEHMAMLVALVRGPAHYDPRRDPEKALRHRNLVLDTMVATGVIPEGDAEAAKRQPLDVVKATHRSVARHPAFLDLVRRQLHDEYKDEDLASTGLRIITTLDSEVQRQLEAAVEDTLPRLEKANRLEQLQAAAIVTQRVNGEVAGLVGGRDPEDAGFNRAVDAVRSIGSLYKPVVYLTALEQSRRYTAGTLLKDNAIHLKNEGGGLWVPKNYDGKEHGLVPLHQALAESYNLATVRLGLDLGVPNTVKTLRSLGVNRPVDAFPSLLLGAAEMSVLDVAQMYQTLADDGFVTPLRSILAVLDSEGQPLKRYGLDVHAGVDAAPVYVLNTVLQEVAREGTARSIYSVLPEDFNVAGKTGTTNDLRDSWFAGFSGDYVGVVWVGRDDNQPAKLTGARGALPIWIDAFRRFSREPLEPTPPEKIELVWTDTASGKRAAESCPGARQLAYVAGSAPQETADCVGPAQRALDAVQSLF
ncbi:penicillin-binding protein 1B [Methylogaea oryzae]|uniref:Penicillin-binding protein 1B n=1 Tax=Methylogaea oryzae TaxID=1295382 RepID=A0A8D4VMG8_9GAMM|nr:penicillin-binding protein 1B [Methylogaea oryzae]